MFRSDPDPFFEKEEYDQNPDYKYVKKKAQYAWSYRSPRRTRSRSVAAIYRNIHI